MQCKRDSATGREYEHSLAPFKHSVQVTEDLGFSIAQHSFIEDWQEVVFLCAKEHAGYEIHTEWCLPSTKFDKAYFDFIPCF